MIQKSPFLFLATLTFSLLSVATILLPAHSHLVVKSLSTEGQFAQVSGGVKSNITYYPGTQRRFAPGIAISINENNSLNDALNRWNTYLKPYYKKWLDPNEGTKPFLFISNFDWSRFYKSGGSAAPKNPKDPNDPAYDWLFFDQFLNLEPVASGEAPLILRITWENNAPTWFKTAGGTIQGTVGTNTDIVPDFSKAWVQQALNDFHTAFAARYNDDVRLYGYGFPETSIAASEQPAGFAAGKVAVMRHAADVLSHMMVYVYQNSGETADLISHSGLAFGSADPRILSSPCGSSNQPFPVYDCGSKLGLYERLQRANNTDPNPPTGYSKATIMNTENNGWTIGSSQNTNNPWGRVPTATDGIHNIFAWYFSSTPRAPSPKNDSELGQVGKDPAGIIPINILVMDTGGTRHVGETPADWDKAFSTFGASGTKAIPALPIGWQGSGSPPLTNTSCSSLTSTSPIPSGYGASYNLFSTAKESLMQATCNTNNTATITLGSANPLTATWNTLYYTKNGSTWNSIQLQGTKVGDWIVGPATATIPLTTQEQQIQNYLSSYLCTYIPATASLKCGCSDTTCAVPKWNLQGVRR